MFKDGKIPLLCYSCAEFNELAQRKGWGRDGAGLDEDLCVVSILSAQDQNLYGDRRWFTYNTSRICILSFYDNGLSDESAIDGFDFTKPSTEHIYIDGRYNPMSSGQAAYLVRFLDRNIEEGRGVLVHCSAGSSRSQGVVRYILDTYPDIEWVMRRDNPCLTPNMHVVRMLKRAYNVIQSSD